MAKRLKDNSFETYNAWKTKVKALCKEANITPFWEGDKDIDGCTIDGIAYADWDGGYGRIEYLDTYRIEWEAKRNP